MGIRLELQPQQTLAFTCPGTEILYGGAVGGGKLLTLSQAIPTPSGWKTMGDLEIGEKVFDEKGLSCNIVGVSAINPNPELWEFEFDDGTTITSCVDHQWVTFDVSERSALTKRTPEYRSRRRIARPSKAGSKKTAEFREAITRRNQAQAYRQTKAPPLGSVRTTSQIVQTLKQGRTTNHSIRLAQPLVLPYLPYPLDPYLLGLWLGDGASNGGGFTSIDPPLWDAFDRAGFRVTHQDYKQHYVRGLSEILRPMGLIGDKHVPPYYLRGSRFQRLSLLQGLMDTDGTVARGSGSAEFCNTNERIVDAALELIVSLGWKARKREGRATLNGVDHGPKWTVKFVAGDYVFRLQRKRDLQTLSTRRTTRSRFILAARRVHSEPGRCIQVDSPSRMYLAGRQMVPTHNSHLMRVDAIHWCTRVPGLQAYLFRRNYPDLRLNHMEGPTSFPELLAPLINKRRAAVVGEEIRFANGSKIHLCHLQYTKSLLKYQGCEIHWLGLDELTHFDEHHYRYLRARCRLGSLAIDPALIGRLPRIVCGTNPGGVGHHWVKRTFIRLGPSRPVKMPAKEGGMIRIFIPAKLQDNPALLLNDPDYEDRLEALGDPVLVRAMKEGDWDVVAGAMFGDTWRRTRHVCEPFPIPSDWEIWRGADDGFAAPASCHWLTQDPSRKTYYVIDEIYRTKMLPGEFAERILRTDRSIERIAVAQLYLNEEKLDGLMDSSAFADTGQGEITRGDQIVRLGAKFRPVEKWPGSVIARVQNLHRLLAPNKMDPDGKPGIIFFDRCKKAIETIPTLPRDDKHIESIDTDADDHAFDSITYALQWKKRTLQRMRVRGV